MIEVLDANQPPDRFYRGGVKIDRFRGLPPGPDHRPEDWVGSTTTLSGEPRAGLTTLRDSSLLRDRIVDDPLWWLGEDHVKAFGVSTMLLVKLLDAGQRLPVHAHPDDAFSQRHLGRRFGKAEAWYILEGGDVFLGLKQSASRTRLKKLVEAQETQLLLELLHRRRVERGDFVFVPAGELHAIGDGVFLLELQQPEDLSILLEWEGFTLDGVKDGHLGLGFDTALEAVQTQSRSAAQVDQWIKHATALPPSRASHAPGPFRLERLELRGLAGIDRGFSIIVMESGDADLTPARGAPVHLFRGGTAVVPFGAGPIAVQGTGAVLICRPPSAPADPKTT